MKKTLTEKSSLFPTIKEENALTESIFIEKVSEVHLLSCHRDHFFWKCKDAPANAVIRMK